MPCLGIVKTVRKEILDPSVYPHQKCVYSVLRPILHSSFVAIRSAVCVQSCWQTNKQKNRSGRVNLLGWGDNHKLYLRLGWSCFVLIQICALSLVVVLWCMTLKGVSPHSHLRRSSRRVVIAGGDSVWQRCHSRRGPVCRICLAPFPNHNPLRLRLQMPVFSELSLNSFAWWSDQCVAAPQCMTVH